MPIKKKDPPADEFNLEGAAPTPAAPQDPGPAPVAEPQPPPPPADVPPVAPVVPDPPPAPDVVASTDPEPDQPAELPLIDFEELANGLTEGIFSYLKSHQPDWRMVKAALSRAEQNIKSQWGSRVSG